MVENMYENMTKSNISDNTPFSQCHLKAYILAHSTLQRFAFKSLVLMGNEEQTSQF
jgi:hypothetical protein